MIETVPPKAVEINKKAFELGYQEAEEVLAKYS
jgi:2-oxoglutarate ferredoxin oxidoreductase subunit gamma